MDDRVFRGLALALVGAAQSLAVVHELRDEIPIGTGCESRGLQRGVALAASAMTSNAGFINLAAVRDVSALRACCGGRCCGRRRCGTRGGGVDIMVDSNSDGRVDFIGHDRDADGLVDSAEYDKNHDGVYDKRMYDDNGDGLLDRTVWHHD